MGNSVLDGRASAVISDGIITKFYTSAAWIDGRAEQQLEDIAGWPGVRKIAAFPDLHPGKFGPVGCAVLANRIYPQLAGNDIGCGMSLFQLDLPVHRLKLDKAVRRLRALGGPADHSNGARLEEAGFAPDLFADALGTIGGGNHFCEVQQLDDAVAQVGLDTTRLYLLVHSGSRGFGNAVLAALPTGAFAGLAAESDNARAYIRDHDRAVRWARLNRQIIAERAAEALRADLQLVVDAPHNLIEQTAQGGCTVKGRRLPRATMFRLPGRGQVQATFWLRPVTVTRWVAWRMVRGGAMTGLRCMGGFGPKDPTLKPCSTPRLAGASCVKTVIFWLRKRLWPINPPNPLQRICIVPVRQIAWRGSIRSSPSRRSEREGRDERARTYLTFGDQRLGPG